MIQKGAVVGSVVRARAQILTQQLILLSANPIIDDILQGRLDTDDRQRELNEMRGELAARKKIKELLH